MDKDNNICQGWIYSITNKVNGKMYIGQTTDYDTRKRHHFCKSSTCLYLKRAIQKYGSDNFEMKVLLTFKAINKRVCVDVLTKLEVLYIRKYDTFNPDKGYNLTAGGEGGVYIRTEENRRKISEALKGHHPSEETRAKYRQNPHVGNLGDCRKPVLLYNLDGSFYKEFESVIAARRALGDTNVSFKSQVAKALRTGIHEAKGYLWRYKQSENYPTSIEPYIDPTIKPVYHYSLDGQLIEMYGSAQEVEDRIGIKANTIAANCRRTGPRRKDYWSYIGPGNK